MTTFQMNKLVRDEIPGKMRAENQAPIFRVVSGRELERALLEKLKEEADEALAALENDADYVSELADVREVLDTLVKTRGITPAKLAKARKEKRVRRGGFEQGYFVETVALDDGSEWAQYYRDQPLQYQELLSADQDPAQHFAPPSIEKGIYRHYKGNYYEVLGVGCHTETHAYFVVYRSLYKKDKNPEIWLRPYDMFVSSVEKDGQTFPRFERQ